MKATPGAANPGGAKQTADTPSGVQAETPDAPLTQGGTPLPGRNQEAG